MIALHSPAEGPTSGPKATIPNESASGSATTATVSPARRFGRGS